MRQSYFEFRDFSTQIYSGFGLSVFQFPGTMTIAEILLFLGICALFYRLLRPLQKRLEVVFFRWLKTWKGKEEKPIIDVTDYSRKNR